MTDIFQIIDESGSDKQANIAERLENRARMPAFRAIRDAYFDRAGLPLDGDILEIGCGTGVVCRAIAARPGFTGRVTGTDLSASLIARAQEIAAAEGFDNIAFFQADGQADGAHKGTYDIVLLHTVISHVADPAALLKQALALVRPGGRVVVHDGDYASMTFDTGAPELDARLPGRYLDAIVANRFVMRQMPALLADLGIDRFDAFGDVVVEAAGGEYMPSTILTYGPIAEAAGTVTRAETESWSAALEQALARGAFFGSCNFVTYVIPAPGG